MLPDYIAISYLVQLTKAKDLDLCNITVGPSSARDDTCSHCWDTMQADEDLLIHPVCRNTWHISCLTDWVGSRDAGLEVCPICRGPLTANGIIVEPDGKFGHAWRPAAMRLVSIRIWLLCLLWLVLVLFFKHLNGSQSDTAAAETIRSSAQRHLLSWLATAGHVEVHRVIVLYMGSCEPKTRICMWFLATLFISSGVVSLSLGAEESPIPGMARVLSPMITGFITSGTLLTKKGALQLCPENLEEIFIH